jgi:hypothetical protein
LREWAMRLAGAKETGFVTDQVTEVWLDFEFRGQKFSINNQHGNYWFWSKTRIARKTFCWKWRNTFRGF